jgi:hypothetical protein
MSLDAPDRRRIQLELGGEHDSAALAAPPSREHPLLDPVAGALGHPDRPRRTIGQRRVAAFVKSAQPLVHRRSRNPQSLSHMRRRPTSSDTLNDSRRAKTLARALT